MNKKLVRRAVIAGASTLVMVYLGSLAYIYYQQESVIFFPKKLDDAYAFSFSHGVPFEEVRLSTEDSHTLHGLHFKADSAKGCVLYLHGNAGYLENEGEAARIFADCGYDVFMLAYRGYGKSTGKIESEEQMHADALTAYEYLKKIYAEDRIVVYAWSIGTGLGVKLAADQSPGLLVLEAPYFSLEDLAADRMPLVPVSWLLRYRFRSDEWIGQVECPAFVFHGTADEVIPYEQGRRLAEQAGPNATVVTLKGGGHDCKSYPDFGQILCDKVLPRTGSGE